MRILVNHSGQQLGPFSETEVQAQLQAGSLLATDLAWAEGTPAWVPLSTLVAASAAAPPSLQGAAPQLFASSPVPIAHAPTSSLAITALVLGILSVTCCWILSGVPAIICGHLARGKVRNSGGTLRGSGMALAGLILGYVGTVVTLLVGPPLTKFIKDVTTLGFRAEAIVQGCSSYASEHEDTYPATLEELVPTYIPDKITLEEPTQPGTLAFDYFVSGQKNPPPGQVVIASKRSIGSGKKLVSRIGQRTRAEYFQLPPVPAHSP